MTTPHKSKKQQFAEVYAEYSDAVFRHCLSRLSDSQLAENITQETFTRAWSYLMRDHEVENMRALLYKIANNLIVDRYRAKKSISLEALQESNPGFERGAIDNTLEKIEVKETLELLKMLDAKYQKVITLRFLKGLTVTEIARELKESPNAISVRIHRGLKQFRKRVDGS